MNHTNHPFFSFLRGASQIVEFLNNAAGGVESALNVKKEMKEGKPVPKKVGESSAAPNMVSVRPSEPITIKPLTLQAVPSLEVRVAGVESGMKNVCQEIQNATDRITRVVGVGFIALIILIFLNLSRGGPPPLSPLRL